MNIMSMALWSKRFSIDATHWTWTTTFHLHK